jgi:hypothetical protein
MNSCLTLIIYECRDSCLLIFQQERSLVTVLSSQNVEHFFVSLLLFTDEARFSRDGFISIHNQHQWAEENPPGVIHSRHQQEFSINV